MRPTDSPLLRRLARVALACSVFLGLRVAAEASEPPRRVPLPASLAAPPEPDAGTPEEEEEEGDESPTIIAPEPPDPDPAPKARGSGKKPPPKPKAKKPKGDPRCGGRTPIFEYSVRSGDHLGKIAGMFGVRAKEIKALNPKVKAKPNDLKIGQKILVCPEIAPHLIEEGAYTARKGDSLSEIAEKHGMTVSELRALQKPSVRDRLDKKGLQPGDELVVLVDRGIVAAFAPQDEDRGVLKVGVPLEPGKHYYIKRPHLAYGTSHTIKGIKAALSRYAQQKGVKGGPLVHVGDISARGGGPLRGHKSHQKGLDVDIGLVLKGEDAGEVRFLTGRADNLDVARTWALLKAFIDSSEVRAIFLDYGLQKILYEHAKKKGVRESTLDELFQYPRGKGRSFGIIRHWKGHRDHFHVRFRR